MSLTDTAEYWWDVKTHRTYTGREFYHIPNADCGHRHFHEAKRIGDVNCFACLKLIEQGYVHGLPEGKTDFRSKGQKKRDKQAELNKVEREKHGRCGCGGLFIKRYNKERHVYFLGCSNYPHCVCTKSM